MSASLSLTIRHDEDCHRLRLILIVFTRRYPDEFFTSLFNDVYEDDDDDFPKTRRRLTMNRLRRQKFETTTALQCDV